MTTRLLALSLIALSAWGANCVSNATGNWSAAATWTSCGGGVPGDGDFVSIGAHIVTLNQNVGTAGNGIKRITLDNASAQLVADGVAVRTIRFASTGTDPIGSGTEANPGTDANMFGIQVCRGTLDFWTNTATYGVVLDTGDGTSNAYINHSWGSCTVYAGVVVKIRNSTLHRLGVNSSGFNGISVADNGDACTVWLDHNWFDAPYRALASYHLDNAIFTFNTITDRRAASTIYEPSTDAPGWTVDDNTEYSPTVTGKLLDSTYKQSGWSVARNAVSGTASYGMGLYGTGADNGATTALTASFNICKNYIDTSSISNCLGGMSSSSSTSTFDHNMCDGSYQCYSQTGADRTVNWTGNWGRQYQTSYLGQGTFITYKGTSVATGNMVVDDQTATGMMGFFYFGTAGTLDGRVQGDRNSVWNNPDVTPSGGYSVMMGETKAPAGPSIWKNGIVHGGWKGISDGDSDGNNTYTADYAGSGVHHNSVYGAVTAWSDQGGANFDDGVNQHPNAVYADLELHPGFVEPKRGYDGYDKLVGGAGTYANFFTEIGKRCGQLGTYNSLYTPAAVYNYLKQGMAPTEIRLATTASDGSYIGAVPPVGVIGAFQP